MKKQTTLLILVIIFVFLVLSQIKLQLPILQTYGSIQVDGYDSSNQDAVLGPYDVLHPSDTWSESSAAAQSFTGQSMKLTDMQFMIRKYGNPSGQLHAALYTLTGTFGVDDLPGTQLATSDPINVSTISTSFTMVNFHFSGSNQYLLQANTYYFAALFAPSSGVIDSDNAFVAGGDSSSPTHPGAYRRFRHGAWQVPTIDADMCFAVYGIPEDAVMANIQGRVLDVDNQPIADAVVELENYLSTTTNSTGHYLFESILGQSYTITVSKTGYQTYSTTVDASAGGTITVPDITLQEVPKHKVWGYVTYPDNTPASGITVSISGGSVYLSDATDTAGMYEFTNIPEGTYTISITVSGYQPISQSITVSADTRRDVQLVSSTTPPSKTIPVPPNGQCYHMAFCSWDNTAAPLPTAARRDALRFISLTGKGLYAIECAGSVCVNEDFWPMSGTNSWKPLLDEGISQAFIFSLFPYLRDYPSDSDTVNGPTAVERRIANGEFDSWIRTIAQQTKEFGYPVMLKIGAEVNGNEGPSQPGGSWIADFGADPTAFKDAYRHIVDIFQQEGVDNVVWVMSYNFESAGQYGFEDYYPGDSYVDWLGVDLYQISEPDNPETQISEFYNWAKTQHPNKPLGVTEWGVNWYNKNIPDESRASYINAFFDTIESKPEIKFIRYHWNGPWRFQDDDPSDTTTYLPLTTAAYRTRIANVRYIFTATGGAEVRKYLMPIIGSNVQQWNDWLKRNQRPYIKQVEVDFEHEVTLVSLDYNDETRKLTATFDGETGVVNIVIVCGLLGQPIDVVGAGIVDYNETSTELTISVSFASPITVMLQWSEDVILPPLEPPPNVPSSEQPLLLPSLEPQYYIILIAITITLGVIWVSLKRKKRRK